MGKGGHGGGAAGAGHSHSEEYPEDSWNLWCHLESAEALNATEASAMAVFKPFVRRLEPAGALHSDGDEELLVKVVFASPCSLRRLMVVGGGDTAKHPSRVKIFVGREDLDFQTIEDVRPDMESSLPVNLPGEAYLNVHPPATFTNVTNVAFFFDANHGATGDETVIQYIGMQGDHTHDVRQAVNATYEIMCQPHATETDLSIETPAGV
mmetsp:Transcript_6074/g.19811  ORF Transcript_6074/g.19811 Transcript_6074/m.19811 type:complete len:209 (+) Transcript_6074:1281-1907(+)|eukprot:CAMPEP_0118896390 /NCGR_PEP_ID=MMETSP1166-20130328/4282_1 /TAXON_ID=1104430 /ORGANISM="Chrysoreinhardia sp, Strain CCMP3193" /LENGTH=208 /DNA_ID=CAMNT_0006835447 /DNA_START=105 /DNA_END=731 /DNA_ORIENTATION=+